MLLSMQSVEGIARPTMYCVPGQKAEFDTPEGVSRTRADRLIFKKQKTQQEGLTFPASCLREFRQRPCPQNRTVPRGTYGCHSSVSLSYDPVTAIQQETPS